MDHRCPLQRTQSAINAMQSKNVTCVEIQASALYAFSKAKDKEVICFAHLTKTMVQQEGDFEKGDYFGSLEMLELIDVVLDKIEK